MAYKESRWYESVAAVPPLRDPARQTAARKKKPGRSGRDDRASERSASEGGTLHDSRLFNDDAEEFFLAHAHFVGADLVEI